MQNPELHWRHCISGFVVFLAPRLATASSWSGRGVGRSDSRPAATQGVRGTSEPCSHLVPELGSLARAGANHPPDRTADRRGHRPGHRPGPHPPQRLILAGTGSRPTPTGHGPRSERCLACHDTQRLSIGAPALAWIMSGTPTAPGAAAPRPYSAPTIASASADSKVLMIDCGRMRIRSGLASARLRRPGPAGSTM